MFTFGRNSVSGMKGRTEREIRYKTQFTIGKTLVQVERSSKQSIRLIVFENGRKRQVTIKKTGFAEINGAEVYNLESYHNSVKLGFEAPSFIKIDRKDKGIVI